MERFPLSADLDSLPEQGLVRHGASGLRSLMMGAMQEATKSRAEADDGRQEFPSERPA